MGPQLVTKNSKDCNWLTPFGMYKDMGITAFHW